MNQPNYNEQPIEKPLDTTDYKIWMDYYAKRNDIDIVLDKSLDAPAAVPDSLWQKKKGTTIIVNPDKMMKEHNLSFEQFLQVLVHEVGHLDEDAELEADKEWESVINQREKKSYREMKNA